MLVLTKKIGTGVIATALKRNLATPAHVEAVVHSMLTLNRAAGEAMARLDVHAVTDITGFGLLGHAREVALASGVTIEIDAHKVQFFDGAVEYAKIGAIAGGLNNNREYILNCVEGRSEFDDLLYDPQTSGGLLIALPPQDGTRYLRKYPEAFLIGRILEKGEKPLRIV